MTTTKTGEQPERGGLNWWLIWAIGIAVTGLLLAVSAWLLPMSYLATGLVTDGCVVVAGIVAFGVEEIVWRKRNR